VKVAWDRWHFDQKKFVRERSKDNRCKRQVGYSACNLNSKGTVLGVCANGDLEGGVAMEWKKHTYRVGLSSSRARLIGRAWPPIG